MSDKNKLLFREHLKKEIAGVFWAATGVFLLLSLISFNNGDPSFYNNLQPPVVGNYGGVFGAHLAAHLFQFFGIPALLIPVACLLLAWRLLKFRDIKVRAYKAGAFGVLLFSLDGLLALRLRQVAPFGQKVNEAGGAIGRMLADALVSYLNIAGTSLLLGVFFLVSLMLVARFSMVLFLEGVLGRLGNTMPPP
jgi:S-DNA-T family DNA segregation ATPase FtsK/SpoIIIE